MCLQCCAKTIDYGEFAPGWYLVRATVTAEGEMEAGQWGLVRINDPDIIFSASLEIPETKGPFIPGSESFSDQLHCSPKTGHSLYAALSEVKYPFAVKRLWAEFAYAGRFEDHLYLYLAWFIKNNPIKQETK